MSESPVPPARVYPVFGGHADDDNLTLDLRPFWNTPATDGTAMMEASIADTTFFQHGFSRESFVGMLSVRSVPKKWIQISHKTYFCVPDDSCWTQSPRFTITTRTLQAFQIQRFKTWVPRLISAPIMAPITQTHAYPLRRVNWNKKLLGLLTSFEGCGDSDLELMLVVASQDGHSPPPCWIGRTSPEALNSNVEIILPPHPPAQNLYPIRVIIGRPLCQSRAATE